MASCSIVIPVHNRASLTRQCLDQLVRGPAAVDAEIVVVDDLSAADTSEVLAEYADRVRVIRRETNGGFAAACNDGAAAASGDAIVFLNNDTIPQAGWLDALERYAGKHPEAAVIGCKLLYLNDTIQHAGAVVCQDRYTRHIYKGFPADFAGVNRSRRFQIVTGAAMFVRREAFEQADGFDTAFVNAYEDHDLCLRLGEQGHEVHYCHESVLYHLEGVTRRDRADDLDRATRLYRLRWAHRLQPDDLKYYVEDGLLQVGYGGSAYPLTLRVSPMLAMLNEERRAADADRMLEVRATQVALLLHENTQLRMTATGTTPANRNATPTASPTAVVDSADLCPPDELALSVGGQFRQTGEEFVQYFLHLGHVKPTDRVLEVGCGVGRMAVPLTRVLTDGGSYEGFDVMREGITWCQQHITPRFPHFRFQRADVYNKFYNRGAREPASRYTFPCASASMDFVFLTSVFTHLLPRDVEHYFEEIARVLAPGGRCFATFFLINDESDALLRAGFAPLFHFRHQGDGYRSMEAETPETAVAYEEAGIRARFTTRGLRIVEPIRYGMWCGRLDGLSLQDIVVATKI